MVSSKLLHYINQRSNAIMTRDNKWKCKSCATTQPLSFCKNCATFLCHDCLEESLIEIYKCDSCEVKLENTEICPKCHEPATKIDSSKKKSCKYCKSTEIVEPYELLNSIPKDFISKISSITTFSDQIVDIHKKLERMIAVVKIARDMGYIGYPSIEYHLQKILVALVALNSEAEKNLDLIKKTALQILRNQNNFSEIDLELFSLVKSNFQVLDNSIETFEKNTIEKQEKLNEEFIQLVPKVENLLYHRTLFESLKPQLSVEFPEIFAVLQHLKIKLKITLIQKQSDIAVFVFLRDCLFILRESTGEFVHEIKYSDIQNIEIQEPLLKSSNIVLHARKGEIRIFGTPTELSQIKSYFDLISSGTDFTVRDKQMVYNLEANCPDGSIIKNDSDGLINIVKEKINGQPLDQIRQNTRTGINQIKSKIVEIQTEIDMLEAEAKSQTNFDPLLLDKIQFLKSEKRDWQSKLYLIQGGYSQNLSQYFQRRSNLDEESSNPYGI